MSDRFRYRLSPTPAVAALLANPTVAPRVVERIDAWLRARGYAIPDGMAVDSDGSVLFNADRDPTLEWATFDPSVPTVAEEEERLERTDALALLDRLERGAITTAEMQRAVAFALRRSLRNETR